jgi:hypothetical protein
VHYPQENGVPQGSMFAFTINGMGIATGPPFSTLLYADDITIFNSPGALSLSMPPTACYKSSVTLGSGEWIFLLCS